MSANKVKLPFEIHPLTICYHYMAFPLGIIQAHANAKKLDITPWIIGKNLNCSFNDNAPNHKYDICLADVWAVEDEILSHQYINMFKDMYSVFDSDIIDVLKKVLNAGCYVFGAYNERHIPGKSAYQKRDFLHDYIIYGFNDESRTFYSAGFLKDQRYAPFEISYENFAKSLFDSPSDRIWFDLWQYNVDATFTHDIGRIRSELGEYVNSTTSHNLQKNCIYGMDANRRLKDFYVTCIKTHENPQFDIRYSRAFMEQKYFIHLCVRYLHDCNIICMDNYESEQLKEVYDKAMLVHRIGMKLNLSKNYTLIDKISDIFNWIEKVESMILPKVIALLEGSSITL